MDSSAPTTTSIPVIRTHLLPFSTVHKQIGLVPSRKDKTTLPQHRYSVNQNLITY